MTGCPACGGGCEVFRAADVARALGCDTATLARWARAGRIQCVRAGEARRYPACLLPAGVTPTGTAPRRGRPVPVVRAGALYGRVVEYVADRAAGGLSPTAAGVLRRQLGWFVDQVGGDRDPGTITDAEVREWAWSPDTARSQRPVRERAARKFVSWCANGGAPAAPRPAPTLAPLIDRYLDGRRRRGELTDRTTRQQRHVLGTFAETFGARDLRMLGPGDVDRWLERFGDVAPSTRRARWQIVRVFTRWLTAERLIRRDPCATMKAPKQPRSVPRALADRDVARLLGACGDDERLRVIVMLMVHLGLRAGEVARLDLGDIDWRRRTLRVTGKGGHERLLPIVPAVEQALDRWAAAVPRAGGPVVCQWDHPSRPLTPETISDYMTRLFVAAGLKRGRYDGISGHSLRHTCASDLVDRGADVRVVQQVLGHQSLDTTQIYLRSIDVETMRAALAGRSYETSAVG